MFDFWSIVRRFLYMLFVLWIVATIIFFMFRLMPGSPLTAFIGTTFTDEQHDLLVKRFGLDKSLFEQYTLFIVNTLKGDFGLSFTYNKPVINMIIEALPNSIILTLFSTWCRFGQDVSILVNVTNTSKRNKILSVKSFKL